MHTCRWRRGRRRAPSTGSGIRARSSRRPPSRQSTSRCRQCMRRARCSHSGTRPRSSRRQRSRRGMRTCRCGSSRDRSNRSDNGVMSSQGARNRRRICTGHRRTRRAPSNRSGTTRGCSRLPNTLASRCTCRCGNSRDRALRNRRRIRAACNPSRSSRRRTRTDQTRIGRAAGGSRPGTRGERMRRQCSRRRSCTFHCSSGRGHCNRRGTWPQNSRSRAICRARARCTASTGQ